MRFMPGVNTVPVTAIALAAMLLGARMAHATNPAEAVNAASPSLGETFEQVHSFSADGTRQSGGATPSGSLIQAPDGMFYGLSAAGGKHGLGALYRMTPAGKVTTLVSFSAKTGTSPAGPLTLGRDGMLYGVTQSGGNCETCGTLFRLSRNGGLVVLHKMDRTTDGATPNGALVQAPDGSFYGTARSGGQWANGTIFRMTLDGTVTTQVSFYGGTGVYAPRAGLTLASDGALYGTGDGGLGGWGGVFRFQPGLGITGGQSLTRYSGTAPASRLVEGPDGYLYGTAPYNGPNTDGGYGYGTIYRVSKLLDTVELVVSFDGSSGKMPFAGLTLASDGNFYGATSAGGDSNLGVLYRMTPPRGLLSVMHTFRGADGSKPVDAPVQGSDGLLRGTTTFGGAGNVGTVFTALP